MLTIDEVIKKGRIQLFWIPISMLFGLIALMVLAVSLINNGTIWIPICGFGGFFLAVFTPLLYTAFMLPRWRIWAFSNVRNVHELKQTAILRRIYPKDKSFFWRLEIKSAAQKQAIQEIEKRFEIPDIFEDDPSIPYQTAYYYPKVESWTYIALAIGALILAVFMFGSKDNGMFFIGLLAVVGGSFLGWTGYKRLMSTDAPLMISEDGISMESNGFHDWKDISNEQVYYVSAGKASYYGLSYEVNGTRIAMSLKELTGLSSYKVDHVLRVYRGRYQKRIAK